MSIEQLSLFDGSNQPESAPAGGETGVDLSAAKALTRRARLSVAMEAYRDHMIARRFAAESRRSPAGQR